MKNFVFYVDKKIIAIERNKFKIKANNKEEANELLNSILSRPYEEYIESDFFEKAELVHNTIETFDMFNRLPDTKIYEE